jgi:CubicO group peptidase (beta-lactamase class C family)
VTSTEERIRRIETGITSEESGWNGRSFALDERMRQLRVPGVSAAVIEHGRLAWARGWGSREAGRRPVGTETMFSAGSISKPVAATAAMRLVQQGVLGLDDNVNDHLTTWSIPAVEDWQPVVTLRQLLSHTAGLTVHGFPGYLRSEAVPELSQILDGSEPANTPPVRVDILPGTQFRYSGGGTTVMQVLLEDVTGIPFTRLVRELVLDPLGMNRSTYEQPLAESWGDVATGHYYGGAMVPGGAYVMPELAAAGLWTTPTDLCRFGLGMLHVLHGEDRAFMTPEVAERMLEPQAPAREGQITPGFFIGGEGASLRFGHGGSNIGFKSRLVVYRELGCGAAVMTNGEAGETIVTDLMNAIAREYDWPNDTHVGDATRNEAPVEIGRHAGRYELRPGVMIDVSVADNQLSLALPQQSPLALRAISDDAFECGALKTRVAFGGDAAGRTLTVRQAGEELVARRVGP